MNENPEGEPPRLPDWVVARLEEACHRVQNLPAGKKLWHERFTPADHSRFDQPWPQVWAANQGTIGLWCKARGTSWNRGIAEAAHALGFLDEPTKNAIIAALPHEDPSGGYGGTRPRRDLTPSWNKALGELRYRGDVIREVKPEAENLRTILDAFQEDGWPNEIYDPFPADDASGRRRRAVATLNMDLRLIRFSSTGNGRRIAWEPRDETPGTAAPA